MRRRGAPTIGSCARCVGQLASWLVGSAVSLEATRMSPPVSVSVCVCSMCVVHVRHLASVAVGGQRKIEKLTSMKTAIKVGHNRWTVAGNSSQRLQLGERMTTASDSKALSAPEPPAVTRRTANRHHRRTVGPLLTLSRKKPKILNQA